MCSVGDFITIQYTSITHLVDYTGVGNVFSDTWTFLPRLIQETIQQRLDFRLLNVVCTFRRALPLSCPRIRRYFFPPINKELLIRLPV